MTTFKLFKATNINYRASLSYGTLFLDGFRTDLFFRTFHAEYFGPEATATKGEVEQFVAKMARFQTRKAHLKILSGAATLSLAFEDGSDEASAACLVDLPEAQIPQLSVWQWIKYKIYGLYVPIAEFFDGNAAKEFSNPNVRRFFGEMYTATGAVEGPEYYAKLADLSPDELSQARYPAKDTLHVQILAVGRNCQGKGYGSKLLLWTIEQYQYLEGPVFTSESKSVQGPPKVSLFPTQGKEAFYNKFGFQTVSSALVDFVGDGKFEHKYMQRFLHNEV